MRPVIEQRHLQREEFVQSLSEWDTEAEDDRDGAARWTRGRNRVERAGLDVGPTHRW